MFRGKMVLFITILSRRLWSAPATNLPMQRLAQSAPAEQAEILSSAREAFERTPRGNAQLRYALLLATPGHPARNALMARILLRELIAQPDALVPIERAVVMVELAQLGHELDLQTDNEHLQAAALRADQQRSAASERQIDAEAVENIRLRKELEAAKAKLDAIASIERNLTDRRTGTEADAATTRPTRRRPARPSAAPGTGSAPASGTSPAAAGSTSPATPGSATAPARAPASTESAPATRASNVPGTTSGPVTGSKDPSK